MLGSLLIVELPKPHDVVLAGSLVRIPQDHGVPDLVSTSVFGLDEIDYIANTAVVHNLRDPFEVRVIFANAVITKVLRFDDSVSNDELLTVALLSALHERFSGNPLGGSNSPPLTFSCSAMGRSRT